MLQTCEYCHTSSDEAATRCQSCGAPLPGENATPPDFRTCPHCHRRLLALGSPACSYCGKTLPVSYQKVREAIWQRINATAPAHSTEEAMNEQDAEFRLLSSLLHADN